MTLPATGERFLPEMKGQIELEHIHRYAMARELVSGKIVLDIASGEGYGSAVLSTAAKSVLGVDISEEAVQHAQQTYSGPNLQYKHGRCSNIPAADSSIDVVVSFETIEHHSEHEEMMAEIKRVLRPKGLLIISSPDRYEYSEVTGYVNPYHVKELSREEFEALIAAHFKQYVMLGQRVVYGSNIFLERGVSALSSYGGVGSDIASTAGLARPTYLIAVASDGKLPKVESGLFEHASYGVDLVQSIQTENDALKSRMRNLIIPATRLDLYLSDHLGPHNFIDTRRLFHRLELSGEIQVISFELPPTAAPMGGLRLDPCERSCALELSSISLRDSAGNLLWEPEHPASSFSSLSSDVMVARKLGSGAIILAFGEDPNMQIDIPNSAFTAVSIAGGILELRIAGRSIDHNAFVELNNRGILLSNEPSGQTMIENALDKVSTSLRMNLETANAESLRILRESFVGREDQLLAQIKSLSMQSESLQDELRAARTHSATEQARMQDQIEKVNADNTVELERYRAKFDQAELLHAQTLNSEKVLQEQARKSVSQVESVQNELREVRNQYVIDQERHRAQLEILGASHGRALDGYREQLNKTEGQYARALQNESALLEQIHSVTTRSADERSQVLALQKRTLDREKILLEQVKAVTLQGESLMGDLRESRAQFISGLAQLREEQARALLACVTERDWILTASAKREDSQMQIVDAVQKRLTHISNWKGYRYLAWLNGHSQNEHFIESAYLSTLGRTPDQGGMQNYLTKLRAGYTTAEILAELRDSTEGRAHRALLTNVGNGERRDPSPNYDTPDLLNVVDDQSFVVDAYHAILGRAPDAQGLENYLSGMRNGTSKTEILAALEQSDEAKSRVAGLQETNSSAATLEAVNPSASRQFVDPEDGKVYDLVHARVEHAEYLKLIKGSEFFDVDFYHSKYSLDSAFLEDPELHFILFGEMLGWQPNENFWPVNYLLINHDVAEAGFRPFFHFLQIGRFENRSHRPLPPIEGGLKYSPVPSLRGRSFSKPKPIALCIHIYYADLWPEIAQAIARLTIAFDLFVVIIDRGFPLQTIKNEIADNFPDALIFTFPNHGRDIFPFVHMIGSGLFDAYNMVGKLHTKKSPHREDGDDWRRHLINGVLPVFGTDEFVETLLKSKEIGIVVADGQIYEGTRWWGSKNKERVPELLNRVEVRASMEDLRFPAGSIYWMKQPIVNLVRGMQLAVDDFEIEKSLLDGTTAHAFERTLGYLADAAKLTIVQSSEVLNQEAIKTNALPRAQKKPFVSCFYLPQFHPIPENDKWWGTGYTEWIGVAKSKPQFYKHNQPAVPEGIGFYDLRLPDVIGQQFKLAKAHGVDAFCVYYYSFDNKKRLLESPIDNLLARKDIDINFYLCWANESWTRNWDGLSGEVLQAQTYLPGVENDIAYDCVKYFSDPRYYRFNGDAPRFVVYRPEDIPALASFVSGLRTTWKKLGFPNVNLGAVIFHTNETVNEDIATLFDFFVEMPPHGLINEDDWIHNSKSSTHDPMFRVNNDFEGKIYSYERLIVNSLNRVFPAYLENKIIRGAMPSWDNTARRGNKAHICYGSNPARFSYWIKNLHSAGSNYRELMINSWNEWGEKAMLEPTAQYGKGYLDALKHALDE